MILFKRSIENVCTNDRPCIIPPLPSSSSSPQKKQHHHSVVVSSPLSWYRFFLNLSNFSRKHLPLPSDSGTRSAAWCCFRVGGEKQRRLMEQVVTEKSETTESEHPSTWPLPSGAERFWRDLKLIQANQAVRSAASGVAGRCPGRSIQSRRQCRATIPFCRFRRCRCGCRRGRRRSIVCVMLSMSKHTIRTIRLPQ